MCFKMRICILLLISSALLSLQSCNNTKQHFVETVLCQQTPQYRKDKNDIERFFIDNAESVRLSYRKAEGFTVNTDSINEEIEMANTFFKQYTLLYNMAKNIGAASPVRTDEIISVAADTIVYAPDSLICVVLMIIENHHINISGWRPEEQCYEGRALIGCRKDKNHPFYLFPMGPYRLDRPDFESTKKDLRNSYFYKIKKRNMYNMRYTCGIDDPEFFKNAPDFQISESGMYNFETDYWDTIPFYKNRASYLNDFHNTHLTN